MVSNHSQNFTDPVMDICTIYVEAYWCVVKQRFKTMIGDVASLLGRAHVAWALCINTCAVLHKHSEAHPGLLSISINKSHCQVTSKPVLFWPKKTHEPGSYLCMFLDYVPCAWQFVQLFDVFLIFFLAVFRVTTYSPTHLRFGASLLADLWACCITDLWSCRGWMNIMPLVTC